MDLRPLLHYINPMSLTYQEWVNIGFSLKHEGYDVDVWDEWSRTDTARYHAGECQKKWQSFRGTSRPVTGATITDLAKQGGWTPKENHAYNWDDYLAGDGIKLVDSNWVEGIEIKEPKSKWNPVQEMITYLSTLFNSEDYVGFVNESFEKDGRFIPRNKGVYTKTAGELIAKLRTCNGNTGNVIGDYNQQGGMWIRFNPLDKRGVRNENVTEFRYALVESDTIPIEKQNEIIRKLELPVAVLVHSGSKSLHAIVHIDASSYEEYCKRVDLLYTICRKNGLEVDVQDRNPSRLSRFPGVMRGDKKQFIVDTNIGQHNYVEWQNWYDEQVDELPDIETPREIWNNLPPLSSPLIAGVLRCGHKMMLAGPSKAGKSLALIELVIAIAEGRKWMGWQCMQGKVLYVNLELDRASCWHRFHDVYMELNIPASNLDNWAIWNLRGKSIPMDKLAPKLIRRAKTGAYTAIVIDPIYKIITGDENSADQMAHFCNQFDKVCTELGCAVIYCHHHSKGAQIGKASMDRASGSGVFARDADALLDMTQIENPDNDSATAWRIEGTLREFAPFSPRNVWFRYPIHELDTTGKLTEAAPFRGKSAPQKAEEARGMHKQKRVSNIEKAENKFLELSLNGDVSVLDLAHALNVSKRTIERYCDESEEMVNKNGTILKQ